MPSVEGNMGYILIGLLLIGVMWLGTIPLKPVGKVLLSALCGMSGLILLNLLRDFTGMVFELNILTALISSLLGLPGLGALVIVHYVLGC